jgi:hypothetical protein
LQYSHQIKLLWNNYKNTCLPYEDEQFSAEY